MIGKDVQEFLLPVGVRYPFEQRELYEEQNVGNACIQSSEEEMDVNSDDFRI